MTRIAIAATLLVALVISACVEKSDAPAAAVDQEQIQSLVSSAAPLPQHPLDIQFEGKIALIGYDLSVSEIKTGEPFEVTWYWKVEKPLDDGWRLFTHLADARGESRLNADSFGPIRQGYPPGQWKAGEYIKDTLTITLPANWNSPAANFLIGIWKGPHRLQISRGDADNENRARVLTVKVAGQGEPAPLPALSARKVTAPITIDGKLDEADWSATQASTAFVNTMTGSSGAFDAKVRVLFDAERIYLGYEVQDALLKSSFTKNDEHLWEQDTIEVMLDPDGDAKNYFEVQVSPAGIVFDTRYNTVRQPRPFGDMAWSSQANAKAIVKGTLNDDGADEGYVVEMSMPWSAFAVGDTPAPPPTEGSIWRINFYVMDTLRDGQRAVAWSAPRVPDFHTPARFGNVLFGQVATPAPAAPSPATPVAPAAATDKPATPAPAAPSAATPNPAASNTPVKPREISGGRHDVHLSPSQADAIRQRAAAPEDHVATPPTAPAH